MASARLMSYTAYMGRIGRTVAANTKTPRHASAGSIRRASLRGTKPRNPFKMHGVLAAGAPNGQGHAMARKASRP